MKSEGTRWILAGLAALAVLAAIAAIVFALTGNSPWVRRTPDKPYPVTPDEAFYPKGYAGYRYPVRPGLPVWADGSKTPADIQIPPAVAAKMPTAQLAQSVVCYPGESWRAWQTRSSQAPPPEDIVRNWFESTYDRFEALQELARRKDARKALAAVSQLHKKFIDSNPFSGIDPAVLLQAKQFGGAGIPDYTQ